MGVDLMGWGLKKDTVSFIEDQERFQGHTCDDIEGITKPMFLGSSEGSLHQHQVQGGAWHHLT